MNGDWLNQLEDIVLPPEIGWWPLASSVWITLITLLGLLIGLVWYFLQRHKAAAYRREAKRQLKTFSTMSDRDFLIALNQLLKQVAITAYGRKSCAGLNHQAWIGFLKTKASFLEQPAALSYLEQRYQLENLNLSENERAALDYYAHHWISGHHL